MNSNTSTTVIAVRHGETLWNRENRMQGQLDSPLTDKGIKQALAMAEALNGDTISALYTSDLPRAIQTARIIAERLGLNIHTDKRLRERNLGILEGLTLDDIQQQHPKIYESYTSHDPDYIIPHGESTRQRFERGIRCVEELAARHPGEKILIITHGGILNSFFRKTLEMPMASPRHFTIFNAALNSFTIIGTTWKLNTWGDIHHLNELEVLDDY
ncbi:MAG: histidine phosphatase family protein [Sedimentisphaerales bacterium]|nr:histidine phosphatase family protein [Sedimentisphaerales bacterium]